MSKPFTVLMPVHNEEKYLPYSLPSLSKLYPKEILVLLDRCTDDSKKVIEDFAKQHKLEDVIKPVDLDESSPTWRWRMAYLRHLGTKLASNDHILFTAADLIIPPKIKAHLRLDGDIQFISFLHKDYPVTLSNKLKRLFVSTRISGLGKEKFLGSAHFFNRKIAWKLENLEELKELESAEDTHLCKAINTKYKSKCIVSGIIHLRPRSRDRDYLCGKLSWSVAHRGFLITIIKSLCLLQPLQIKGYIHERWKKETTTE